MKYISGEFLEDQIVTVELDGKMTAEKVIATFSQLLEMREWGRAQGWIEMAHAVGILTDDQFDTLMAMLKESIELHIDEEIIKDGEMYPL